MSGTAQGAEMAQLEIAPKAIATRPGGQHARGSHLAQHRRAFLSAGPPLDRRWRRRGCSRAFCRQLARAGAGGCVLLRRQPLRRQLIRVKRKLAGLPPDVLRACRSERGSHGEERAPALEAASLSVGHAGVLRAWPC